MLTNSNRRASTHEHLIVYSTTPSEQVAKQISKAIVQARLAACVNILPGVSSVYWWDDKVNESQEHMLIIKTRNELMPTLTELIRKEHPYDVPEIVAHPITAGSQDYLNWITASTRDAVQNA